MQKVRIYFSKTGRAKYISHLDLMRTFMRAMKRSGVKIKYTEGFNPHPHIVFGNPLSLGYESMAELCEVKMQDDADLADTFARLKSAMPDGIEITAVEKAKKDFKQIGFSRYRITIEDDKSFNDNDADTVNQLFSGERLEIVKKSKSFERTMDILPLIPQFECVVSKGNLLITAVVAFNNSISLNPDNIVKARREKTDILTDNAQAAFMKLATLDYELDDFR